MSNETLRGTLLNKHHRYSLAEFCQACGGDEQWIIALVEEGILDPTGTSQAQWRFGERSALRALRARRMQKDFELDLASLALVLELLDEIQSLRARLRIAGAPD